MNKNLAIGARFSVGLEKCNRSDSVGIADMVVVISGVLGFSAMVAGVLVADATFPSGRDESIAIVMSAAMNEVFRVGLCGE